MFESTLLEAADSFVCMCALLFKCLLKLFYLLGIHFTFLLATLRVSFGIQCFISCLLLSFFFFFKQKLHT